MSPMRPSSNWMTCTPEHPCSFSKRVLTLRGVVIGETGYRVVGAKVSHGRFFAEAKVWPPTGDGAFALPALRQGRIPSPSRLTAFAPQRIQVQMASNTAPLAVELKPGALLRLRVLDEAGAPSRGPRCIGAVAGV